MDWAFDYPEGYGDFGNAAEVLHMEELNLDNQKTRITELWQKDSKKYYEWKKYCISRNQLPELFGTRDNPIPIDESKL